MGDTGGVDGVDLTEAASWLVTVGTEVNCDVSIILSAAVSKLRTVASVYRSSSCVVSHDMQETINAQANDVRVAGDTRGGGDTVRSAAKSIRMQNENIRFGPDTLIVCNMRKDAECEWGRGRCV